MQRINLICYADEKYARAQERLIRIADDSGEFNDIGQYTRELLILQDFYKENKYILDNPKGAGYACWKPYIILDGLEMVHPGDIILYIDSGDLLFNTTGLKDFLIERTKTTDFILTTGAFKNSDWTRRDCFYYMGCDEPKYWNCIQLEAGILAVKKSDYSIKIINEWLEYCKDPRIITDDLNVCGLDNFEGFREGRYDQSVLSNLAVKYGLYQSSELRNYIECNANNSLGNYF